ncbi:MAG: class I SAM-dependent methyltransferase [Gammaproteobacteria bacterium]
MKSYSTSALVFVMLLAANWFSAQESVANEDPVAERIMAAMSAPDRGPYDARKDAGRKPIEMLSFFKVRGGMTILDMLTGAGYSSELLAAAVGPDGIVYAQNSFLVLRLIGGEHHRAMMARLADNRLPNVRYMVVEPEDMPFEETLDFAMWGLNMHDEYHSRGEGSVLKVLRNIKRGLKPNGILAISDHVGLPGQDNKSLHRIEPEIAQALIEKAGFLIEASSDLLANPNDDHTREIFDDDLRYQTDQFLIRARKP